MSNDYVLEPFGCRNQRNHQVGRRKRVPLVKVEVSHKSHPFYTGKAQFVDTAGRIDKFRQKYGKFDKKGEDKKEG